MTQRKIIIRGEARLTYDASGKLVPYDRKIHGITDEHKAKISDTLKGKKHTKKSRKNMSDGRKKAWAKDPRKISDEKIKYIIRLRVNENKTPTEIGELLDIDRKMVSKILRREGISSHHKLPDETYEKVVNMYKGGKGITEISLDLLISRSTIEKIIQRSGVPRHKSK